MKNKIIVSALCAVSLLCNSAFASDQELYFYNWSEYIPNEILTEFTQETGIKVIYSTYESNESLYAKLKSQQGYDLVVPSTYFVSKMRKEGMLQPIDRSQLPNFFGVDELFLNKSFDPNNQFSIPYTWGGIGIGVNSEMVDKTQIHIWGDLWDSKWKKQLLITEDSRELFHIALVKLGYSPNTTNSDEINEAYDELRKLVPNVKLFNSDFPINSYIAGEVSVGMLWSGSAYIARQEGVPIDIVWPEKGAIFRMDSLAIPASARNVEAAHKMIDFLLRPENSARIALEIGYPTPVKTAYSLLPSEFVNDSNIFPPQSVIENGQWQDDVGDASLLYEQLFEKLRIEE
jgi:spermidine/putrescine transport system substrate-binding protein